MDAAIARDSKSLISKSCHPIAAPSARGLSSISMVLPAYNESAGIAAAISEADDALATLCIDYELIVVDDGSTDDTTAIARAASANRPNVRVIQLKTNAGYGNALQVGFRAATKELIGFTDADRQFDLHELDRLLSLARHYDIVCGYRIDRQDPWIRKLYSNVYNGIVRTLLGTRVRDCDCALKVFRRDVIHSIPTTSRGFFFNSEVLARARLKSCSIVEVGVTHRPRLLGTSTVSIRQILPVSIDLVRFWWNEILFPTPNTSPAASSVPAKLFWTERTWVSAAMLIVACLAIFFWNLDYPLFEPDESRYAQISLEMIQQEDWVTPRLRGEPYLDKPPLLYWLTASSILLLGETPRAVRTPIAISAMLTVLATYFYGRKLVGEKAALYAAAALLLSGGYALSGRFLIMDGLLTLFTTVSVLAGAISLQHAALNRKWWFFSSVACGLGVLTKGPVALILCLPPLLAHQWLSQGKQRITFAQLALYCLPAMLFTLPWFVVISMKNPNFSLHFLWEHHVVRFTSAFNHREPWWFYGPTLLVAMFPASMLLPSVALSLFGRCPQSRAARVSDLSAIVLSALWTMVFFSLSTCKLPTYILPAVPLFCLLIGHMIQRLIFNPELRNGIARFLDPFPKRTALISVVLWFVAIAMDARFEMARGAENIGIRLILITVLATILAGWLARSWSHQAWSSAYGWAGSTVLALIVSCFVFSQMIPNYARQRSILETAKSLLAENPERPVICLGPLPFASVISLPGIPIESVATKDLEAFTESVRAQAEAVIIAPSGLGEISGLSNPDGADHAGGQATDRVGEIVRLTPVSSNGKLFLSHKNPPHQEHRIANHASLQPTR